MFRKFKFEEEIYEKFDFIPLSTRYKFDTVGIKLSLESWSRFAQEERLVLCHLSVRSQGEKECYRRFLLHLLDRLKQPASFLSPDQMKQERSEWENPIQIPREVYQKTNDLGYSLSQQDWLKMDDLERYALYKLAKSKQGSDSLEKALREFGKFSKTSRPLSELS